MISRIFPSAFCLLLAPLLVAEQVHNDAQTAVNLDRVAVTVTQPSLVTPIKTTQTTAPASQSTSVSAAPVAGNTVSGQNANAGVSTRHRIKNNISTALKGTGEVLAFIALLPLTFPLAIVWIIALLVDCRNGCDP